MLYDSPGVDQGAYTQGSVHRTQCPLSVTDIIAHVIVCRSQIVTIIESPSSTISLNRLVLCVIFWIQFLEM